MKRWLLLSIAETVPLRRAWVSLALIVAAGAAGCGRSAPRATSETGSAVERPTAAAIAQQGTVRGEVEVDLRDQTITGEQIDALINNPSLRRLRLGGSDIDDAAIARIAATTQLELLDVVNCARLTSAALQPIGSIATLRNLRLGGAMVNDQSIVALAGLNELAAILLQQTDLSDRGIDTLATLPKLKEVNLFGSAAVTDTALATLAKLPALEKLRLRGTGVTGDHAEPLKSMTGVTELDLSETAFGNAGMSAVARMPALKQLNLWLTRVDDAGIAQLREQADLTSLNLDNVPGITDASLEVIGNMHELTFLHLGGTSVTPRGLQRLQSLTKLRTLIITRLGLTPQEAEAIRQSMPWVTRLEAE